MRKNNLFTKILYWIKDHRKKSIIFGLVILAIAYGIYKHYFPTTTTPEYTLSVARIGSIHQTISGTGQVTASNQTDIPSLVSGTIKSINVNVGDQVKTGDLIATIDSTNAKLSLESSRIAYLKVTQPAKESDIQLAKNNLSKTYDSAFNTIVQAYADFPTIISNLKDTLYGQSSAISIQSPNYLGANERSYRDQAVEAYDRANIKYQASLVAFKNTSRYSSDIEIDNLMSTTIETANEISQASNLTLNTLTLIKNQNLQITSIDTLLTNVTSFANKASNDVSSLVTAQNSVISIKKTLSDLATGSDDLDIASARLSYEQAQRTYENYFIRAPYDGIIGRIPVNVYSQAGSGTTIATIVGNQKIANISLNEVDAAKVRVGQNVDISFDAIEGLSATGTVKTVDQVGSVSSGVVSYSVKISINTEDERIKPGMSVNTSITTLQKDNILIIPNTAIKQSGKENYVQTLEKSLIQNALSNSTTTKNIGNQFANSSTTRRTIFATSTRTFGTTTQNHNFISNNSRTITISTNTSPNKITIKTGDSDDTYTEIISGLNRGDFIITKTSNAKTSQTTSAPSIFSSVGARNPGSNVNRISR
jgi:HlyD family secretion protein